MSKELTRIQKRNNLNKVVPTDQIGNGGAFHKYEISTDDGVAQGIVVGTVQFQDGGRHEKISKSGVTNEDLLEIVRHRLQCFQKGDFSSRESAVALTHVENALLWLNKRIEDRAERGVLGLHKK